METSPLEEAVKIAGSATALARLIGRRQSTVWDWLKGPKRKVDPEGCIAIEKATNGQVTAARLRPDLATIFRSAAPKRNGRAA